MLVIFIVRIF